MRESVKKRIKTHEIAKETLQKEVSLLLSANQLRLYLWAQISYSYIRRW